MNAKIMLLGGPHADQIIGLGSVRGEWPPEIRVAEGPRKESEDKIEAAVYVKEEISEFGRFLYLGSYRYVGMKPTTWRLVQVWKE